MRLNLILPNDTHFSWLPALTIPDITKINIFLIIASIFLYHVFS